MLKPVVKLCGGGAVWLVACCAAFAQQYSIATVAGGAPPSTPVSALSTTIGQPRRVAVDGAGNAYFSSGNSVFKVSGGTLTLVAGNSRPGFSGDGSAAVNAQLNAPTGVAVDASGRVYIADTLNNRVRVVTADGIIRTFAGNGAVGSPRYVGDEGAATDANLQHPSGVAVDSSGNVYIADTLDNIIRKVTTDGLIHTIAGNYYIGAPVEDVGATASPLDHPQDVTVDSKGNIYIADTSNGVIREVTISDGNINTVAGNLTIGYSGDGGAATSAGLDEPFSVALDSSGNLYIDSRGDGRIRKVDSKGNISTVVGNGTLGFGGDNGAATSAQLFLPMGVAVDSSGNIYIADTQNNRVRKVASGSNISTIAGNGGISYSGDSGPAIKAQLNAPQGIAVDSSGNYYIADTANNVVRKVAANGTISTFAGNGSAGSGGDGSAATSAQLNYPQGVAADAAGNVYIADTANSRVRKVSSTGTISTVAGNGTPGYSGDGAVGSSAEVNFPVGLAVDGSGNLYIADTNNSAIRKVTTSGIISTVAGTSFQGYSGDQGPATAAQLNDPQGVAVDGAGNIYIADTGNNRVRRVSNGTITTLAGNGLPGYSGDGGKATAAQIASPTGIAVDPANNVFVSDGSAYVRKIDFAGTITTAAGNGSQGYSGDGGSASNAMLNRPTGTAADTLGNIYIADTGNSAIRQLQFAGSNVKIAAVTNGASNSLGSIAPGEVVVIYGSGLGPASLAQFQLSGGLVPTTVGGTSVYFNGQPGPVLYSSATQVSAIVPFGLAGATVQVTVFYQGAASNATSLTLAQVAPALFTANASGSGQVAAINQDGTLNSVKPIDGGKVIQLFGTGFGQLATPSQDGQLATAAVPTVQTVTATVGGKTATVTYSGAAPTIVNGVQQINVQIPAGLAAGNAEVILQVGGVSSPKGVTISVSGK
jgi:uncharacterized protein (TIGR03437 family)